MWQAEADQIEHAESGRDVRAKTFGGRHGRGGGRGSDLEVTKAVKRYLKTDSGAVSPDEMAKGLGIDYRNVLSVVRRLLGEGKIEESAPRMQEILLDDPPAKARNWSESV